MFMGTPEFAVETLKALVENNYNVVAVVTQPDRPVGRHQNEVQPSEVKKFALAHNLPVLQPEKMKDPAFIETLRSYEANLQVVVAFRMLPEVVWDMPEYGTFNVHAALLPQYRGAAPINWAVINGETQTGVTTFFLDKDIDTGRIILQKPFEIPDTADVEYVYDGLMHLGAEICLETLEKIVAADGLPESMPQAELRDASNNSTGHQNSTNRSAKSIGIALVSASMTSSGASVHILAPGPPFLDPTARRSYSRSSRQPRLTAMWACALVRLWSIRGCSISLLPTACCVSTNSSWQVRTV